MYEIPRGDGVSLASLEAEIARVPFEKIPDKSGSARGDNAREGWINGLRMARIYGPEYPDLRPEFPSIDHATMIFANQRGMEIVQIMVNELAAHSALEMHRDGPPEYYRWHLPITTNEMVQWYDEIDGWLHMSKGHWFGPVNYCNKLHSMTNDGDNARIHVVMDLQMPN